MTGRSYFFASACLVCLWGCSSSGGGGGPDAAPMDAMGEAALADAPSAETSIGDGGTGDGGIESSAEAGPWSPLDGGRLPTGDRLTPTAAPGSTFQALHARHIRRRLRTRR